MILLRKEKEIIGSIERLRYRAVGSILVTYPVATVCMARCTYQVPLFLEERVREQVLKWHAPISLAMEQGGLSRTRTKTAEEGLIIGERIGRGAEVALLALLLMLLLEPVHLQPKAYRICNVVFLRRAAVL